jgi:hypothetical protein
MTRLSPFELGKMQTDSRQLRKVHSERTILTKMGLDSSQGG